MKTRTVVVQEGEHLGPIDWSYDFTQHDWGPGRSGINPEHSKQATEWLRALEADPQSYEATTDGGWPKMGWSRVIQVGMYDGWPFWRPVPSVLLSSPLGSEWHSWYDLSGIEKR
ncbi:MAG: hypothetical protein ACRDQZ_09145 [Mycobacteriales bacterium]